MPFLSGNGITDISWFWWTVKVRREMQCKARKIVNYEEHYERFIVNAVMGDSVSGY